MNSASTLVWFRKDLRLADHPALWAAAKRGAVIPVFIWAPEEEGAWSPGAASHWWLHHALDCLDRELQHLGSRLLLRRGPTAAVLLSLVREGNADAVYWNRRYEPVAVARDARVTRCLKQQGIGVKSFEGALLHEPGTVMTKSGGPFQVFTPFWKACLAQGPPEAPLPKPAVLQNPATWPQGNDLDYLKLKPRVDWAAGLRTAWAPGSQGGQTRLERFVATAHETYQEDRDRVDLEGFSRLSPHLHFGEVSPRQVWAAVARVHSAQGALGDPFLRQIGWREFAHHLLCHFPHTPEKPLRASFKAFPWERNEAVLKCWQQGQTGVPLVDAAMRHLWHEGWMPNRARMVVASYLTKNLLMSWQAGAAWFWDTLVDADLANNTFGWQWTAGCGADAAPYFRIFNPVSQAVRYDPDGDYIRRWVPALRPLPPPWLFKPWEASAAVQASVGTAYPEPLVDLRFSRERALHAYQKMRQGKA